MPKTNVDDRLIEMITPKVKEIEERFSRGEGLSNEDINTLLLKSQYNHINHLDGRLDEVTASVRALEGMFQGLEGKFDLLKAEVNGRLDAFDGRLDAFDGRFDAFEGRLEAFEKSIELKISEAINTNMRWSIGMIALIVTVLKLADMFTR
jgi:hypothetical protein